MPISNQARNKLNEMCPAAREALLGAVVGESEDNISSLQTDVSVLQVQVSELEGNVGDPVQDIATLKDVGASDREDKQIRAVEDANAVYIFDAESVAVGDDDLVVVPDDVTPPDPGRWLKTGGAGAAADISYDNSASGLVADNVQDAIDEVYAAVPEEIPIYDPNGGKLGLNVIGQIHKAIQSLDENDQCVTAFDVIKSIHGVPVQPITYYLKRDDAAYGPGNTNPKAEKIFFDCDDLPGIPDIMIPCHIKIEDSTLPAPQVWCEVPFAVKIEDSCTECNVP